MLAITLFINSCCNFNLDFFWLIGSVAGFDATSFVGSATGPVAGSAAGSDVGWRVGILSKFFTGNNLL